ncbi:protein CNPPD1 [Rhynchophorus ferrugineus]|uniref:protein CNPPD1 n=1 Tax=Rhynchophorus ferrugineus TaxID=354439 RepID=UPI003FCCBAE3
MSKIYKKPPKCKGMEDHQKYLSRITKTLYYGKLPKSDVLSLPVTELAAEIFSETHKGKTLERLHCDTAAQISRNACVSPCSLVLAMIYLERLKKCNVEYLERTTPSDLFLVSLMVSSKYLFDDGEVDEVYMDEWAASSEMTCKELVLLERDFLKAIDWQIFVNELSFWKKFGDIERQLAKKEGINRGSFTYTELQTLSSTIDINNIVQCLMCISVVLAAAYTAGLLTVVGSVYLTSHIPGNYLYQARIQDTTLTAFKHHTYEVKEMFINKPCNETALEVASAKHGNILNSNALKVFRAGILLASIQSGSAYNISKPQYPTDSVDLETESCQQVGWDWWNIPAMIWLSKASDFICHLNFPPIENYIYFLENKATNNKLIYLEDHIQKATKTRIQDQIESSWHTEWIDSIRYSYYSNILPFLQNVKS